MVFAAFGLLPPLVGAMAQEVIDLAAVLNALRVALPPSSLQDFASLPHRLPTPASAHVE
jgi:hypothetical protein